MKKFRLICLIAILVFVLAGCGKSGESDDGKTNITIAKNGEISYRIRDSFTESYYNIEELKSMINEEVGDFNSRSGGQKVSLESAELANQIVNVVMKFSDDLAFSGFNGIPFFVGNGNDAIANGQSLDAILTDIKDATKTISGADLRSMSKENILVYDGEDTVYLPSKILYVSDNCSILEGSTAVRRIDGSTGAIYVVYK